MTLPKDVAVSMSRLRCFADDQLKDRAELVESHLLNQDAEIERLQNALAKHVDRVCGLQSRLAAADALLQELSARTVAGTDFRDLAVRILAHVQGGDR